MKTRLVLATVLLVVGLVLLKTSDAAEPPRPEQPAPDIFPCGTGCDIQLLNPLTVKAKATRSASYRLLTMPGCNTGTVPEDMAWLEGHLQEKVGFRLLRDDAAYDFTVRVNCGSEQIRYCGAVTIFCLGRGFPYNPDVEISDIISNYFPESRRSILCHEICGHSTASHNEQYCRGTETSGICRGLPLF